MMSVAPPMPGITGIPISRQRSMTGALNPGVMMNVAPAATARSTSPGFTTVQAPTRTPDWDAIVAIACSAASERNVTSATGRPPRTSAAATPIAESGSLRVTTGMTRHASTGSSSPLIGRSLWGLCRESTSSRCAKHLAPTELVDSCGNDEHDAGRELLQCGVDVQENKSGPEDTEQEGAEYGAGDRSQAACDARAADDRRGDDGQFEPVSDVWSPRSESS